LQKEIKLVTDEELIKLQQDLFIVVEKYIHPEDIQSLLLTSGVLLKTAIQLYTVGLVDNAEVEKILDFSKSSIEPLRERTKEMIDIENRTLH
tara:strand:- start:5436 stop:5711 length:276 start_codon:yes stop_codon:yes gene_type:complete